MIPKPLITIVVNCYNRADMICTALDSVWNQSYRPIELIVVDDGSKDNTFEVVQEWIKQHPDTDGFTTIAKTFPNGKLCVARNRGLELAHGNYIQYVDDDDWLYPNAIAAKAEELEKHPEIDLLVNQLDFMANGKKVHTTNITVPQADENAIVHLLTHECLMSPSLMFKTEALRRIGAWKPGLIFADDMEITLRLAILGGTFGIVDRPLSGYRIHNQVRQCTTIREKLSMDFVPQLYIGLYKMAKDNCLDTEENRLAFARILRKDAGDFIRHGRYDSAQLCLSTADVIAVGQAEIPILNRSQSIPFAWRFHHNVWRLRSWLKRVKASLAH